MVKVQKWKMREREDSDPTQEKERETYRETSAKETGRKKNTDRQRQKDSEGGAGVQRLVLPQTKHHRAHTAHHRLLRRVA